MSDTVRPKAAKKRASLRDLPELIEVPDFARWAGMGVRQCYASIEQGLIPSVRLSERRIAVPRAMAERWLRGEWKPEAREQVPALKRGRELRLLG